ncbi:unnamed protein product [Arctia plantaginis]|uniref:Uncharacterized protein n=1 Tax=Arctia plantaginis TaxID=874455 RepID=A0A8S1A1N8_ARCPL|nr:unnamed protein product [Arctia plantaginis]
MLMSFEAFVRSETASWDANAPVHEEWLKVKHLLTTTAAKAFGYQKVKSQDWFAENVEEIRLFDQLYCVRVAQTYLPSR